MGPLATEGEGIGTGLPGVFAALGMGTETGGEVPSIVVASWRAVLFETVEDLRGFVRRDMDGPVFGEAVMM